MVPRYRIGIGEGGSQVFLPDRPRRIHFQLQYLKNSRDCGHLLRRDPAAPAPPPFTTHRGPTAEPSCAPPPIYGRGVPVPKGTSMVRLSDLRRRRWLGSADPARRVFDWGALSPSISLGDTDDRASPAPLKITSSKSVVPPNIQSPNAHPVTNALTKLTRQTFLEDRI
jgi:hypothetical protein